MILRDLGWFILKDNPIINLWVKYCTNFEKLNTKKLGSFRRFSSKNKFYINHKSEFIDKEDIRSGFDDLTGSYKYPCTTGFTSGTTNTPLKLKRSIKSIIYDEACLKKHWYEQGAPLMPKIATLRGDLIPKDNVDNNIFWLDMRLTRRLIMSSFHLSPNNIKFYLEKLDIHKPDIILAYPSAVITFSRLARDIGWKPPVNFIGVFASGEYFSKEDQVIVKGVLGNVFDHYGQAERVARLQQCSFGKYHVKQGYSYIEFTPVDDKYEVIGTTYHNKAMPLVKYRTGDFISKLPSINLCRCGLTSQYVEEIEGREGGVLVSASGKEFPFAGLSRIVYGMNNLAESQYVQTSITTLLVRYSTINNAASPVIEDEIGSSIYDMLGDEFVIIFEYMDNIPRNKSGKLSAVVVDYE
jgi:phenylacetate-CoA ligase